MRAFGGIRITPKPQKIEHPTVLVTNQRKRHLKTRQCRVQQHTQRVPACSTWQSAQIPTLVFDTAAENCLKHEAYVWDEDRVKDALKRPLLGGRETIHRGLRSCKPYAPKRRGRRRIRDCPLIPAQRRRCRKSNSAKFVNSVKVHRPRVAGWLVSDGQRAYDREIFLRRGKGRQ